jgi:hypothetical protein
VSSIINQITETPKNAPTPVKLIDPYIEAQMKKKDD